MVKIILYYYHKNISYIPPTIAPTVVATITGIDVKKYKVVPIDCKVANIDPATTAPPQNIDCIVAANEPAAIPTEVNPARITDTCAVINDTNPTIAPINAQIMFFLNIIIEEFMLIIFICQRQ